MAKLVEGFAARIQVPAGARDVQVFDDELPGFGIRKFASGRALFPYHLPAHPGNPLRARLRKLYRAAYRRTDAPSEDDLRPGSEAWNTTRARTPPARPYKAAVEEELAKLCGKSGIFRPRKCTEPDQLVTLAVIGSFQLEGDRALGSIIRRAAGLPR